MIPSHTNFIIFFVISTFMSAMWFLVLIPIDQPDFQYHQEEIRSGTNAIKEFFWFETKAYASCSRLDFAPIEFVLMHSNSYCGFLLFSTRFVKFIIVYLVVIFVTLKIFKSDTLLYQLCLFTPGLVQGITFYSLEAAFLVLCIMCIRIQSVIVQILLFCMGVAFFDRGSAFLYLLFVFYRYFWISFIIKSRLLTLFFASLLIFIITYYGLNFLRLLEFLPIYGEKLHAVWKAYSTYYAYVYDNYSPLLRPILTFSGFFAFTPQAYGTVWIGLIIYIVIYSILLINVAKSLANKNYQLKLSRSVFGNTFLPAVIFILCSVILMPGYSNVKYYLFLLPLILEGLQSYFHMKTLAVTMFSLNAVSLTIVLFEYAMSYNVF